jgi:hypothetical protein
MLVFLNDIGIDTIRFLVTYSALLKKLKELSLEFDDVVKLSIYKMFEKEINKDKAREDKYMLKTISINSNSELSSYIIVKINAKTLNISNKQKKKSDYKVEVIFTSLNQHTKKVDIKSYEILNAFIKRFKIDTIDIAFDTLYQKSIDRAYISKVLKEYVTSILDITEYKTSIYINNPLSPYGDFGVFDRILIYDKYIKNGVVKGWKRVEVTLSINTKLNKDSIEDIQNHTVDLKSISKLIFDIKDEVINTKYIDTQLYSIIDKRRLKSKDTIDLLCEAKLTNMYAL